MEQMDTELASIAIVQRQQQQQELERAEERDRIERMRREDASVLAERQRALNQLEGSRNWSDY